MFAPFLSLICFPRSVPQAGKRKSRTGATFSGAARAPSRVERAPRQAENLRKPNDASPLRSLADLHGFAPDEKPETRLMFKTIAIRLFTGGEITTWVLRQSLRQQMMRMRCVSRTKQKAARVRAAFQFTNSRRRYAFSAPLACATIAPNASGSFTARSASTLRSTSMPARFRPLMKRE